LYYFKILLFLPTLIICNIYIVYHEEEWSNWSSFSFIIGQSIYELSQNLL